MNPDHTSSCLLTDLFGRDENDRKPLSVGGHHEWRESTFAPARDFDPIDELVEELRKAEFEEKGARP